MSFFMFTYFFKLFLFYSCFLVFLTLGFSAVLWNVAWELKHTPDRSTLTKFKLWIVLLCLGQASPTPSSNLMKRTKHRIELSTPQRFWAPKSWLTPHRCWKFAQDKNTTVQSWKHKYGISPKTSQNHEIQSFKWKLKNKPRTSKHDVMVVGVTTYLTTVWYALDFQCITISQFTHE